ncbi:30S ribosomal protein S8 [Hydrogenophilus thermoluteolus]|uniref:30S ribosomal protein S8 n=1 Tax=Hydrogenophilus thermoluteolus TaxID=297 RepID=UPI0024A4CA8F|nr:30S ribosomal protein S8 [Hydrogenophilus thermoluteolus]GLW60958.1 30S ribosomal protein S8 [Hydrogenophilus thermoluteolus]
MSMTDPIADMLTRIRNAQMVQKSHVEVPNSKLKEAVAKVLHDEGYIAGYEVLRNGPKATLKVALKYYAGRPVIDRIERVSRPGLRIYRGADELPKVQNGLGIAIVSTPKGVMSDREARKARVGGEVLCIVA